MTNLETQLSKFTEADWLAAVEEMQECVHAVDRDALRIWFRFYPLDLRKYIANADDQAVAMQGLAMQGDFDLANHIATSHNFLFGHRYWPAVKCKIEKIAGEYKTEDALLLDIIKEVGIAVAEKVKADRSNVNAISAIGLATLAQVGLEAFSAANGEVAEPKGIMSKSPDAIVAERAKDDSQGVLGFLKSIDKKYSVAFTACDYSGKFPVVENQQVTHAAAQDRSQAWQEKDGRCWEGPIPVECTAASCGTCWVGVIGGKEKLGDVTPRERRAMITFGYNQPEDEKPFLRLACQTFAHGNATIVIPPWNGVFGKKVRGNVEDIVLEPNTTSAKRLREIVKEAVSGE
ncbi:MAG TPA: 2Fe-2S iron-sulfur cluster-binding protein [Pyrinomonadaceae bacterium]|nr:2Fe-2S iron-sulfur cluster-binding protein [Pyrinomonadaceae bacterium]